MNCSFFEAIERVQFAQDRLSTIDRIRTTSKDSKFLIGEVKRLDPNQIAVAHTGELSTTEIEFLVSYVEAARQLSRDLALANSAATSAYFEDPNFRMRQYKVANLLPRLNCDTFSPVGSVAGTQRNLRSVNQTGADKKFTIVNVGAGLAIALILTIVAMLTSRLISARQVLNRRRSRRFNIQIDTKLQSNGTARDLRILDLSCNGAKIQIASETSDDVGCEVQLWIDNRWLPSKISWHNMHYMGLNFNDPLSIAFVRACVSQQRRPWR